MSSLFISHWTKDKPFVERLSGDLERHGHSCWVDQAEILVGSSLLSSIEKGISKSDYVVIVISQGALERKWVRAELEMAFSLEVDRDTTVILPLLIEDSGIPPLLSTRRYADFRSDYDNGLLEVLKSLDAHQSSFDLRTAICRVEVLIERLDGSRARISKNQTLVALKDGVASYIERYFADGNLLDFSISPGTIVRSWTELGLNYSLVKLDAPLKRGEKLQRVATMRIANTFQDNDNYYAQHQDYPTDQLEMTIRFPKGRPPKSWAASCRQGIREMDLTKHLDRHDESGKPCLSLVATEPNLGWNYVIDWKWRGSCRRTQRLETHSAAPALSREAVLATSNVALYIEGAVSQKTMTDIRSHERRPPAAPGEPTALNNERAGQCDEVLRHGLGSVRTRGSWKSHPG